MVAGCAVLGHSQLYQRTDDQGMFSTSQTVQQQQLLKVQRGNLEGIHTYFLEGGPSQQGMQLVLNTLNLIKRIITLGKEAAGLVGFGWVFFVSKECPASSMEENLKT